MGQNVVKIKSRIKSVTGAYKVTSAMKLVSTVKLKQWKNKMRRLKEQARKDDTRSKIQLGGLVVKALCDTGYRVTAADIDQGKYLAYLLSQQERGDYVAKALGVEKTEEESFEMSDDNGNDA